MNQTLFIACFSAQPLGEAVWKELFASYKFQPLSLSSNAAFAFTQDNLSCQRFIQHLNEHYKTRELQVLILAADAPSYTSAQIQKLFIEASLVLGKIGKLGLFADAASLPLLGLEQQKTIDLGEFSFETLSSRKLVHLSHMLTAHNTNEIRLQHFDLDRTEQERLYDQQSLLSRGERPLVLARDHDVPIDLENPLTPLAKQKEDVLRNIEELTPELPWKNIFALGIIFFVLIPGLIFSVFWLFDYSNVHSAAFVEQEQKRVTTEVAESTAVQALKEPRIVSNKVRITPDEGRGTAYLTLMTVPADAEVMIDDTLLKKRTPLREITVVADLPMTIRVRKKGYKTKETMLTLQPGENKVINMTLVSSH